MLQAHTATTIVTIEVCQWLLVWKKWGWPRLGKCWIPRNPILKLTSSFKISEYILHISSIYQISMNLDMKFKKIYPSIFENSDIWPLFHRSFQPIFHLYFWMFYQYFIFSILWIVTFDLIYYQKYKHIIFPNMFFYIIYIFIKYKKYKC